ncbi:LacI family DNA-binding transcriptional regulator [uncultured Victivallis sp.]|uniref:LacI family DNA-binding transcriptional regulator n=1 Tax=uncultured Victivallis sp. TaxID=354118 RepID=UPI0025E5EACF|nr:LacI family DNA-binding transcriptional regulator [uncultured Victivallis sp.]
MPYTVKEIGRVAGVSPATVSRVMNGSGNVTAEKREQVLAVIERLTGSRPAPRSGSRVSSIGVILPKDPGCDPRTVLQKLSVLAARMPHRWNLLLLPPDTLPAELESRRLRGELAGILLFGHAADSPELAAVLTRLPHIWLNSHRCGDSDRTTLMGNEFAGRIAARYLLENRCRRCAVLSAPSDNPGFAGRISGFRFELFAEAAPCTTIELVLPQGENGFESLSDPELELVLARAMPALKQGAFDGIFSPEERMTALLCRVFAKDPPPRRPRLISCNHTPEYFAGLFPRPASIDLGPRMLAELALRELMRRISGEEPRADHVAVIVTPQLVPGE